MKIKCPNGCWKIFMKWTPEWITTGHNIWKCSKCGESKWFDKEIDNPNRQLRH